MSRWLSIFFTTLFFSFSSFAAAQITLESPLFPKAQAVEVQNKTLITDTEMTSLVLGLVQESLQDKALSLKPESDLQEIILKAIYYDESVNDVLGIFIVFSAEEQSEPSSFIDCYLWLKKRDGIYVNDEGLTDTWCGLR